MTGPSRCRRPPSLPQAGQGHQRPIRERDGVRLFLLRPKLLPLIEVVDRHDASTALKGLAEDWFRVHRLGHRIDRREADLDVLGPIGHETPPPQAQSPRSGFRVIADDRQVIGRSDIPTRGAIRRRILGWDSERDFDLRYIGFEFGPSARALLFETLSTT